MRSRIGIQETTGQTLAYQSERPAQVALLREEIARIRESGLFSEGSRLANLFEFLASSIDTTDSPKESVIAAKVFGKVTFQSSDDATVRVYIHRLRKKLDEFYASKPAITRRVELKQGEYRFTLSEGEIDETISKDTTVVPSEFLRNWRMTAAFVLSALAALGGTLLLVGVGDKRSEVNEIWARHHDSSWETMIIVGDYYLYGEATSGTFVNRLIRDFEINSAADLEAAKRVEPERYADAQDVDLYYLPVSVGYAVMNIAPQVARHGESLRFIPASRITPEIASHYDLIYIGLLSGLPFTNIRLPPDAGFEIGHSFDEIVDADTGTVYRSEEIAGVAGGVEYRDYGYIGSFAGPVGNVITVIAGTRDTGLKGAATLAVETKLDTSFASALSTREQTEAVIEVSGIDQVNTIQEIVSVKN